MPTLSSPFLVFSVFLGAFFLFSEHTTPLAPRVAYDAENRIISVHGGSTATYFYDAEGRRAEKSVGSTATSFVYDLSGRVIADYQTPPGGWWAGYVYANGKFIAEYAASTTYFIQTDHLGSTRLVTAMNQSVLDSLDYLPFGEQIQGDTYTSHKFTDKIRDSETNLDEFGARFYSSQLGRFMSSDWSAVPAPVPYANLTNPQTLNLYAIVSDNPESFADLDGHCNTPSTGSVPGDHNSCPGPSATKTAKPGEGKTGDGTKKSPAQNIADAYKKLGQEIEHAARNSGRSISAVARDPRTIAYASIGLQIGLAIGTDGFSEMFEGVGAIDGGEVGAGLEYSDEVKAKMDQDPMHNFPSSFDREIIERGKMTIDKDGYKQYELPGSVNGHEGTYEIGIKNGKITHRFFRPD